MRQYSFFKNLQYDFPAALVVFLVAVPLCLAIALASGAPLFAGIISGFVGGIVVATISGSHVGVSGPAAGLVVIVADAIVQLGTNEQGVYHPERGYAIFLSAVVLSGIIQLVFAFLRAGIIGYFFPNSVIKGMLAAIGLLIILKQIPHAVGHDVIPEGFEEFIQQDGENTFTELIVSFQDINIAAVIITLVSMGILLLWERPFMKKKGLFKIVQGPLVVVLAGIGFSLGFEQTELFNLAPDEMVRIPIPAEEGGVLHLFSTPDWSMIFTWDVLLIGFTIAVVASLETLLCVEATDKLDPAKHVTPTNRELIAQGVGNIVSGLIGGLPVTQVIVRSSANIQSGGRSKASAFIHGVLILLSALLIPQVLNLIPLSSLAAILFVVGFKLAQPALFKEMIQQGWKQFFPFIVTIVGILFTDLLIGIVIGIVVSVFLLLRENYRFPFNVREEQLANQPLRIILAENVTFLNKAAILQALSLIPNGSEVEIDVTQTQYIHPDVIEILQDFKVHAQTADITLTIKGDFNVMKQNRIAKLKSLLKRSHAIIVPSDSYLKSVFMS